jgi:hypothetical protein
MLKEKVADECRPAGTHCSTSQFKRDNVIDIVSMV